MKYLYIILIIILAVTAHTVYTLWPEKEVAQNDAVVTINGHSLTRELLRNQAHGSSYHEDDKALLDSLITRELLIQEAQNQEIDKEPGFRKALKTYYEQSLIKILMDRQYGKASATVTDEETNRYLGNYGKKFTYTQFPMTESYPPKILIEQGVPTKVLFDDLSDSMKMILSSMKPGETKELVNDLDAREAVRLDKITPTGAIKSFDPAERQAVEEMLIEFKKQQDINSWIRELRSKASIQVHTEKK